jgi:hypothetical protein
VARAGEAPGRAPPAKKRGTASSESQEVARGNGTAPGLPPKPTRPLPNGRDTAPQKARTLEMAGRRRPWARRLPSLLVVKEPGGIGHLHLLSYASILEIGGDLVNRGLDRRSHRVNPMRTEQGSSLGRPTSTRVGSPRLLTDILSLDSSFWTWAARSEFGRPVLDLGSSFWTWAARFELAWRSLSLDGPFWT